MQNKNYEKFLNDRISLWSGFTTDGEITMTKQDYIKSRRGIYEDCLEYFRSQPEKTQFNSFVVVEEDRGEDDETPRQYVIVGDADYVCHMACKVEIWGDLSREHIVNLVVDGEQCDPPTWEPDMIRHIYRKKDNELVFEAQFENWDH